MGIGIGNLFRVMDEDNKQRKREEAGIAIVNGLFGIARLNIPHEYEWIEIGDDGYFFCRLDDVLAVYNSDGKFLFECTKADYCKQGMFLVGRKKQVVVIGKEDHDDFGYALYHEDKQLSEPIFRHRGMSGSFNKFGFCVVGIYKKYSSAIINKAGDILLGAGDFDYLYINGVIGTDKKNYVNLLTGDVICEKGYSSTLDTDDFMFVKEDSNCVYQMNKNTGEFIIHGEKKKPEPPIVIEPKLPQPKPEPVKKIGRNELCPECEKEGVKIKFKKCDKHNV